MAVVGESLVFGIVADEASLVTQSVSVTNRSDKKEARDKSGVVIAVSYYNETSDITIEGLGKAVNTIGASLSLTNTGAGTLAGDAFVDEVTIDLANEEFVKSSIRGTAYEGIST